MCSSCRDPGVLVLLALVLISSQARGDATIDCTVVLRGSLELNSVNDTVMYAYECGMKSTCGDGNFVHGVPRYGRESPAQTAPQAWNTTSFCDHLYFISTTHATRLTEAEDRASLRPFRNLFFSCHTKLDRAVRS